jgi:hypothetical protein
MPTLLQNGGLVPLWSGWTLDLPPCNYDRNTDGSWSAWASDWVIDITIIEVGGDSNGQSVRPENMLGSDRLATISGSGWIGTTEIVIEGDQERPTFRSTAWLAATNTMISASVSCFTEDKREFSERLIALVSHESTKQSKSCEATSDKVTG